MKQRVLGRVPASMMSTMALKVWAIAVVLGSTGWTQVTQRVSVDSAGAQGNSWSGSSSISADGRYVAFLSGSSNLVAGDTNAAGDVFVHDRQLGTTERVSVDSSGAQGNNDNDIAISISADGRFVAFYSLASNLVPGDTNGRWDAFVRDRLLGTTERVSVDSGGVQGNGHCQYRISISADGRFVAFESLATNLVPGDTNGIEDVFVHDRQTGMTERASLDSAGVQGNASSYWPSISADGRYVGFVSSASNLVPGDTNGIFDVFVHDRQTASTTRASVDSSGAQANAQSTWPSLSADGRYVAFDSLASNLVPGDTNGIEDVFVHDRQTGMTERASLDSAGAQGSSYSKRPSISGDGRYVAFASQANNLVPGDTNAAWDAFVHDLQTGLTTRVSVNSAGMQGNLHVHEAGISISGDGRYVAFGSQANNLVPGDTNAASDVFVHDRDVTGFTSLCDPGLAGVIACPCSNPPSGSGRGCDNFGAGPFESGTLTATGVASLQADTVVLTATGENNTSLTVFFTGMGPPSSTGVAHGAGVRCVTQALRRLYTHAASGGTVSAPVGADLSVSARTAQVYANVPIAPGETRYYFNIYRDPQASGPCGNTASTVNLTNAGSIAWNP